MCDQLGVVARPFDKEAALKRAIRRHFKTLGFTKNSEGELVLPGEGKTVICGSAWKRDPVSGVIGVE